MESPPSPLVNGYLLTYTLTEQQHFTVPGPCHPTAACSIVGWGRPFTPVSLNARGEDNGLTS